MIAEPWQEKSSKSGTRLLLATANWTLLDAALLTLDGGGLHPTVAADWRNSLRMLAAQLESQAARNALDKDVYVRQNNAVQALVAQTQASAAFAKVLELAPSPAARFEWFDSMLFGAELVRDMGKHNELATQLLRLQQFSQAHNDEFKTRPDLLAILAKLQTGSGPS